MASFSAFLFTVPSFSSSSSSFVTGLSTLYTVAGVVVTWAPVAGVVVTWAAVAGVVNTPSVIAGVVVITVAAGKVDKSAVSEKLDICKDITETKQ